MDARRVRSHTRPVTNGAPARERELRVLAGAICLSALGDGIALVALGLRAKELAGGEMGGGLAIAGIFIALWAPVVALSGHVDHHHLMLRHVPSLQEQAGRLGRFIA